jgi:3',5'-cyclic AMP phosphodiesterase CpdA
LEQFSLSPADISVVPGNHDCYIPSVGRSGTFEKTFAPFIEGDQPSSDAFPFLRVRGDELAIVGLSSARPSPPMMAVGTLGDAQLERAEAILGDPKLAGRFRIVVLHHPPESAHIHWHNRLTDGDKLLAMLKRVGAELVLHGHLHRTCIETVAGPQGAIPVAGVCSGSWVGAPDPARCARYHLYERTARGGVEVSIRRYDKETDSFVAEKTLPLSS